MNDSEELMAGAEIRRRLVGDAYASSVAAEASPLRHAVAETATRHLWAAFWTREKQLDLRTRSIVTIALLVTKSHGCDEAMRLHFGGALRNGFATRDELVALILQCALYAGYPAARKALRILVEVADASQEHAID